MWNVIVVGDEWWWDPIHFFSARPLLFFYTKYILNFLVVVTNFCSSNTNFCSKSKFGLVEIFLYLNTNFVFL
jgi:hypothetical protein